MSLGFRDHLWSEADRYWNYGLWQPRYLLDAFRPIQMGLPGLYLQYKADTSVVFLLSYFYLPDIIIYPRLKDNQVDSANPFFLSSGSFNKFHWGIKDLELFSLDRLFKPIIALQIQHFVKNHSLSLSYAYKPINQFQYSIYIPPINLSKKEKKQHPWEIKDFDYSILSHHLASLEWESDLSENLSLFASLFYEKPEKKNL